MRSIAKACCVISFGIGILACVAIAQNRPNTLTHKEAALGWKFLFNGKNLDGWESFATLSPPATGDWTVQKGGIVCPGTSSGWLASNHTFTNFELRLEFRGSEKVNSGVFLRSTKEGAPYKTGYELQIWDYEPTGYITGSLVGSLKAVPTRILDGQWNDYDVTADGDHYLVILNGKTILDDYDSKHSKNLLKFAAM